MTEGGHALFLGLGSNLGHRRQLIYQALRLIEKRIGRIERRSSLMESAPWGFESCRPFLNAVVLCRTTLTPHEVLRQTQTIERLLGKRSCHATTRDAGTSAYHDRPIDIDILLYDEVHLNTPELTIPHPLMQQRDFVMKPLNEILQQPITDKL